MRKVVFVIESLGLGGAEKSLVTLLQNLDYTKYSVSLILFQKEGIFKKFVPHQVNVICLENKKVSLIDRVKFKLYKSLQPNHHPAQLFWKVLNKKIKPFAENFDVAIAYNQGFATYYTSQYINADIKYAWVNTDYKKAGYNLDFDLQFYKFYNKIISVSPEAKEVLENLLSERKMVLDIDVIKDITDKKILFLQSEEFVPVEFNKLKINILTVGRLSKHKALHLAIEACKILIDKGYDVNWFVFKVIKVGP